MLLCYGLLPAEDGVGSADVPAGLNKSTQNVTQFGHAGLFPLTY